MLAARFVRLIATLLAVSFLTFFLVNTLPGDPINALIPPDAQQDREFVEQLREEYGPVSYTHLTLPTTPYV